MATENIGQMVSREAGTNVTNKRFVVEAAGGKVNRASVEGQRVQGVVAMVSSGKTGTTIDAGDEVPVAKSGDVIMEAGDVLTDGMKVMTDNTGRPVEWDDTDPSKHCLGQVVNGSSAGAAGEDVTIELDEAQPAGVAVDYTAGLGANLASAATIAPTHQVHHVTGTAAVADVTPLAGLRDGAQITLIPDGAFTMTNAGNVAVAVTAVVKKALILTWDATATKWYPSYT